MIILASLVLSMASAAGDGPAASSAPANASVVRVPELALPTNAANPVLWPLEGDLFAVGTVRLNKAKRAIQFPAVVNMTEGLVEYAVVHTSGKVHESVLKTEADPFHIQLARLLVWPDASTSSQPAPGTPRDRVGPQIRIQVEWNAGDGPKSLPLEDLVWNTLTKSQMIRGPWVFNGSRLVNGTLLAQRDGSIVAIYADPDALINNPRPGRNDDEIWTVNTKFVPPLGKPVTVTMQLENENE
ncbi:MAG: YdjY domain-containing protein [Verrucomicrobiia bacterium]